MKKAIRCLWNDRIVFLLRKVPGKKGYIKYYNGRSYNGEPGFTYRPVPIEELRFVCPLKAVGKSLFKVKKRQN